MLGDWRRPRGLFTTVVIVSSLWGEGREEIGTETHSLTQHPCHQHIRGPAREIRLMYKQTSGEIA